MATKKKDSETAARKPVTAARVQAWYSLLVRCGLADALEVAMEAARPKTGQTVTAQEQVEAAEAGAVEMEIAVSMHRIMKVFAEEDAVVEMAAIVFDLPPEEAEFVSMDDLSEEAPFFVAQSLVPMRVLLSFGANI